MPRIICQSSANLGSQFHRLGFCSSREAKVCLDIYAAYRLGLARHDVKLVLEQRWLAQFNRVKGEQDLHRLSP